MIKYKGIDGRGTSRAGALGDSLADVAPFVERCYRAGWRSLWVRDHSRIPCAQPVGEIDGRDGRTWWAET